jgi:alkylation response protein AidB-like acyl-CoA dehydrogenase
MTLDREAELERLVQDMAREHCEHFASVPVTAAWTSPLVSYLLRLGMPHEFDGHGRPLSDVVEAMRLAGRHGVDPGLLFSVGAQIWSFQYPLLAFGTPQQHAELLPPLLSGAKRSAHAATEPEAGSDVFALASTARHVDGGYRLSGTKSSITGAPSAHVAFVLARVDAAAGPFGYVVLAVDLQSAGATCSADATYLGLRTADFGKLHFDDCFVPTDCRLGREGSGLAIFGLAMDYERAFVLSPMLGAMERQLITCVDFVNRRRSKGRNIGSFQSVSNRIAEMRVRIELARGAMERAVLLAGQQRSFKLQAATAKLVISEYWLQSSIDALRIQGAQGYADHAVVGRDIADSLGSVLFSGTSDIQRNIIASLCGVQID